MKYKFTTELSAKGIRSLRNELQKYKTDILPLKLEMLSKRLAESGVNFAKSRIVTLDAIFTGELLNSIHAERTGNAAFVIVADSKHAVFVEFGTGQEGLKSPYPVSFPNGIDWGYNKGNSIRQATENIYVHGDLFVKVGEYFWSYIGEDGKLHITKGMPSRPFMYETWLELYSTVEKIAKEVFNNVGN